MYSLLLLLSFLPSSSLSNVSLFRSTSPLPTFCYDLTCAHTATVHGEHGRINVTVIQRNNNIIGYGYYVPVYNGIQKDIKESHEEYF